MAEFFDDDIIDVRLDDGTTAQYYWGEPCTRAPDRDEHGKWRVEVPSREDGTPVQGFVKKGVALRQSGLLRLSMVDVQQGDGLILQTPSDKVVFIDGGDNKLFARRVAKAFPGTSDNAPLIVDAMVITHGDADHFAGLNELRISETKAPTDAKKVFVAPKRVYHNGIVKRPGKTSTGTRRKEVEMFGGTLQHNGVLYVTDLVDDIRAVPQSERNGPFNEWAETLDAWDPRTKRVTGSPIELRRIDHTSGGAFDFLAADNQPGQPEIAVELLGPIVENIGGDKLGLRFLRTPPDGVDLMSGLTEPPSQGSLSASHTINGHSINFRLRYGNVRFLFTGDMNHESMRRMHEANRGAALRAEILKAPHHGSADFDMGFLREVGPAVSIISSGDENVSKEYIHPRATLMAALGKASRQTPAIIFCTELAAFFAYRGPSQALDDGRQFEGFERLNFGIIHIRTDGERVLAFTHSGKAGMNEAYRFTVSPSGDIHFEPKVIKRSAPAKA